MIRNNPITPQIAQGDIRFKSSSLDKRARRNSYSTDKISMTINNAEITTNKPAEVNFCGLAGSKSSLGKRISNWFYTSNSAKELLEKIDQHNLIFSAAFALVLTCILRPASIMVLPSKKNQDDQKYAAAHSVASGVIGFAISTAIFTPIQNGVNILKKKLEKEDFIKSIVKDKEHYLNTADSRKTLGIYLDRLPDVVFSAPKGILTVALIPPILKYCFGWEKKKTEGKHLQAQKTELNAQGGLK